MATAKIANDFVTGDSADCRISKTRIECTEHSSMAENLKDKPLRVWCSGSFDLFHYGHADLLRKAKQSGPNVTVVAGIYSDAELRRIEGEPVFNEDERYQILDANKWVDEVVLEAPVDFSPELMEKFQCNYAIFGAKDKNPDKKTLGWIESGQVKLEKKSKGISSANIIHRILSIEEKDENNNTESGKNWPNTNMLHRNEGFSCTKYLQFSQKISPKEGDKVIYVAGSFDLFHSGHVKLLKDARELGDFLYVGIHSDETVRKYAGKNYPILRWDERVMAVLSCKYVSDVIINAPFHITEELINEFSVNVVAAWEFIDEEYETNDPYKIPLEKDMMMYAEMDDEDNKNLPTTEEIVKRVHSKWFEYEDRLACSSSSDFLSRGEQKSKTELGNVEDIGLDNLSLENP